MMPPETADERRSRFEHEAQVLARLSHPNIATVYDFDRDERTQTVFMTMEVMEAGARSVCLACAWGAILLRLWRTPCGGSPAAISALANKGRLPHRTHLGLADGWISKYDIYNLQLVAEIRAVVARFPRLELRKVKGHAGVPDNELVDDLVVRRGVGFVSRNLVGFSCTGAVRARNARGFVRERDDDLSRDALRRRQRVHRSQPCGALPVARASGNDLHADALR